MYIFFLAAAALLLAAVSWHRRASVISEETPPPEDTGQRLRQIFAKDPRMTEELAGVIHALEAVMEHPELGGPGFLMIQFPSMDTSAIVTAQYPNIREGLYRRIVRQELDQDDLIAAGIPAVLLSKKPAFETESGGVVMLSVRIEGIPPEFAESLRSRRDRSIALDILAEVLAAKLPRLSVRIFGTDLLLSPERAATSTNE